MIYLDSAATSFQKPPEVRAAVLRAMERCASPGRGGYREAMTGAETVYRCRERCADFFDCAPEQVVFTSSATHSLNIAIKSMVGRGDRVVVSAFEHNAVMRPLAAIGAAIVVAESKLFDRAGTLAAFRETVTPDTKAVICTHVSNVFGFILPLREIAALCRERNVPLIVDAAQSAGILPLSLRELGAAYLAMPGHKGLYGPQGTGVLICGQVPEQTLLEGGTGSLSQQLDMPDFLPDRLEPGTANVPGIAGLEAGLRFVQRTGLREIAEREAAMIRHAAKRLERMGRIRVFSGPDQSGVLSVQFADHDCETAAELLARKGIAVRAGLQCAPLAHAAAGTLETGTVRLSTSAFSTERDIDSFLTAAAELCGERESRKKAAGCPCNRRRNQL